MGLATKVELVYFCTMTKPKTGGPNPKVRDDDARLTDRTATGQQQPFEIREGEREKIREYARVCMTSRQMGLLLRGVDEPIHHSTICNHFADEIAWGKANLISLAGGKLIKNVEDGKESSIQFVLRTQGDPGQFVERRELSGPNGGPIPLLDVAALAELTDEELESLGNLASKFAELAARFDTDGATAVPDET